MKYLFLVIFVGFGPVILFAQENNIRTISQVRSLSSPQLSDRSVYVSDADRQGVFRYDPSDKNTADDSVMTLVTTDGSRFKRVFDQDKLNVRWFGATGSGSIDDWYAVQKGINYILNTPAASRTLYFPPGAYRLSRPLIIARFTGTAYRQASINLQGPANAKDVSVGGATLITIFNNSFALGIQSGKGVLIKDLAIRGQFAFPNRLSAIQVDTLSFNEWKDGVTRDNRVSPYAGIVIDPFSDSTAYSANSDMYPGLHAWCPKGIGRGGSTAVQIIGCSVSNFIVGVMITPSNQQNGELIDLIDCDLSYNKVGYAMGQAQSKECHVEKIKCWGATHTLFDNISYGFRHGDGAAVPMVDGVNIAGNLKQLCRIYAPSFSGVFRNVYSEGLFRIGYAGGGASLSFEDCQFDFATKSPGEPYPDAFIVGSGVSFHNCMLRCYTGVKGMRLILSGSDNYYEGGVTNEPPIAINVDDNGVYPHPRFKNIQMYYSGGILGNDNPALVSIASPFQGSNGRFIDPVYYGNTYRFHDPFSGIDLTYKLTYNDTYERIARLSGNPTIHVNKTDWTAWLKLSLPADTTMLRPGDFLLTWRQNYQDQFAPISAPTNPVGIIQRLDHDTIRLINLAYGIQEGMQLELWADYYVNETAPFTGNLAVGSNTVEQVQGTFPSVNDRPDMPMMPSGSYVTAVDVKAKKIRFSNTNKSSHSFTSYTFMNGYPDVEMYSAYDLPTLLGYGKTLIGGSTFYQYNAGEISTQGHDYPLNGNRIAGYRNINTHFRGDTTLHKFRYVPLFNTDKTGK